MKSKFRIKVGAKVERRTAPVPGVFVVRKTKSAILICKCGNKYIQTRKSQKTCVRCMYYPKLSIR